MQMSLPPWERGLKLEAHNCQWKTTDVAPPVGAWIEIFSRRFAFLMAFVAPPVGAWIEMIGGDEMFLYNKSLPPSDCPKTKLGSHPQT